MKNNLIQLAHQGSVKAIMEVLNKQLQDTGVSTRVALGANGVLEILCEAGHPENLDKRVIVSRIQRSLDQLSPRPFRQVHIQSCLTNDVQSLWVSTLSFDARRKLLWSEKIQIRHLSWLKRTLRAWGIKLPKSKRKKRAAKLGFTATAPSSGSRSEPNKSEQKAPSFHLSPKSKLVAGAIAAGVCGWLSHDWWQLKTQVQGEQHHSNGTTMTQTTTVNSSELSFEPFNQAVRLAIQASNGGQSATTYGEWVDLANRWQQASELMKLVAPSHPRYAEAQERVLSYRQNSELALAKAKALAPDVSP